MSEAMTRDELGHVSNGIWMCYRHGKLIDTDEDTYTAEMLSTWRQIAELRAELSQARGRDLNLTPRDLSDVPLPTQEFGLLSLGSENALIGEALSNSCVEAIWGSGATRAVRDVLIEVVRNAFTHGGASTATVFIGPNYVEIVDDGQQFFSGKLADLQAGGGSNSLRTLREEHSATVIFRGEYAGGRNRNRLTHVRSPEEILGATPCSVLLKRGDVTTVRQQLVALTECDTVYLVLPQYLSLSDTYEVKDVCDAGLQSGRRLVLISRGLSEAVVQDLERSMPNVEVVSFDEQ